MAKRRLTPNTTLYPVPVVLITCGAGPEANVFSLNRIASCNAEPPMLGISVRPARASHDLIAQGGEFVVNIPWADMEVVSDFVGTTTTRQTDKWAETGLTPGPAAIVRPPLLAECPVNLECQVRQAISLPSHTLFLGEVVALHAEEGVLDPLDEATFDLARTGLLYRATVVRERPVERFKPRELAQAVRAWKRRA